jgi:hypothetical protein
MREAVSSFHIHHTALSLNHHYICWRLIYLLSNFQMQSHIAVRSARSFLGVGWYLAHLVRRPLIIPLYQSRRIDDGECGAVGGMRIGMGKWSTRRKPAPVTLCPPRIPHDLSSNPGRRCGKPATNHLSYGTACEFCPNVCLDYFRYNNVVKHL